MDAQAPPASAKEVPLGSSDAAGSVLYYFLDILSSYGWFITLGVIIAIIVWSNLEPKYREMIRRRENDRISAQVHKDPDSILEQHETMLMARRKLQEQHDQQAEFYKEKMDRIEEEKRNNRIADWEGHLEGKGYRSRVPNTPSSEKNTTADKKPKKSKLVQNDYNPLMGSSSGSGFRPSRQSGATGGG